MMELYCYSNYLRMTRPPVGAATGVASFGGGEMPARLLRKRGPYG